MSNENTIDLGALIQLQEQQLEGHIIDSDLDPIIKNTDNDDNLDSNSIDDSKTDPSNNDTVDDDSEIVEDNNSTTLETETESADDDNDSKEITAAQAHYEFIKEHNALVEPEGYEFDGSPESLEELYAFNRLNQRTEIIGEIYNGLSEDFKEAFKFAANGGTLANFLEVSGFNNQLPSDISTEEAQVQAIKSYYKETTKYSDSKIDSMIERLKKLGEDALEEEAEDAIEYIQEARKQKAAELAASQEAAKKEAEKAQEQQRKALEQAISSSEFIPQSRKNKVKAYINNLVTREDGVNTEFNRHISYISMNPEHKAQLADIVESTYDPKKGFDMSRYTKQGKTQATSDFKDSLEQKLDIKGRMNKGKTYTPTKEVPWGEILKQYD